MSRSVYGLSGLLVVALVLSYLSWAHEADRPGPGSVTVVDLAEDAVESFRWIGPETQVQVARRADDHGSWLEVTVSAAGETPEVFTGGAQARRLVEAVAPLIATRRIEDVPEERLESMGLTSPETTLEIAGRGRTHTFEVGGRTYGGGHQYLRRQGEEPVFLVEAGPLRPIEHGAQRLMQRDLVELRRGEIAGVVVEGSAGRSVEMVHREREEAGRAYFAEAADPDRRVELYANWIGKLLALRAHTYVQAADAPADLETVARIAFRADGSRAPVGLELLRRVDDAGEAQWYARSDHLRALVSLPATAAAEVAADLDAVLGG